ncbi:hypothetical protein CR513_37680, partial [Mucuna pruriens]
MISLEVLDCAMLEDVIVIEEDDDEQEVHIEVEVIEKDEDEVMGKECSNDGEWVKRYNGQDNVGLSDRKDEVDGGDGQDKVASINDVHTCLRIIKNRKAKTKWLANK